MYVWLTEYLADSAGFVYQQAGILNYNVTADMVCLKHLINEFVKNCLNPPGTKRSSFATEHFFFSAHCTCSKN